MIKRIFFLSKHFPFFYKFYPQPKQEKIFFSLYPTVRGINYNIKIRTKSLQRALCNNGAITPKNKCGALV